MSIPRICYCCRQPLPSSRKLICLDCEIGCPDWEENFSGTTSGENLCDNGRMAATVVEGTARKPVHVNADEPCPIADTEVTARKDGTFQPQTEGKGR